MSEKPAAFKDARTDVRNPWTSSRASVPSQWNQEDPGELAARGPERLRYLQLTDCDLNAKIASDQNGDPLHRNGTLPPERTHP
jgi:hypothetical protein